MPIISVIVPVYNVEKYLHCCVDSILAQTITDIEVLLVDDGSTDGSGAICDEYAKKDSRVRVFHKENGGVSSARNLGLDHATGKWIMFVDSDDKVMPEICERLLSCATDVCIPICMWYDWNGDIKKRSNLGVGEGTYSIEKMAELRAYGGSCARLFLRQLVENAGLRFTEGFAYGEDIIFNYGYYTLIEAFAVIDEPLYYYRILPSSLSHGRFIPGYEKIIREYYRKILHFAECLGVNSAKYYDNYYGDYFSSMCALLANNMHKNAPDSWLEKMRRNNEVLRSEEFKRVFPYRHKRPKDFTKRYIHMLELSYYTGNYFWLWLLGLPGKIRRLISGK